MKFGLASAGVPLLGLAPSAGGQTKAAEGAVRGSATVSVAPNLRMFYREDWLGAPWLTGAEPVVFLHGNLETGEIWFGWVPRMAQRYRLYRPDLPGYGGSAAPADFEWSLANFAKVVASFMDAVGLRSAHIVGAKTGGAIAMQFAATYPERTRSVIVASGPFGKVDPQFENSSQQVRLGSAATKAEMDFFEKLRTDTPAATRRDMQKVLSNIELDGLLPKIQAPTLIITSDKSALQSVQTVVQYQAKIPHSRLLVLTSDAYHVAVANAEECVTNALAFLEETKTRP